MSKSAKRKPGRPSLGKRQSFTFRVRDNVRDLLVAAAQASHVSVSEEIERRVEQSFSNAGVVAEMFGGLRNAQLLFTIAIAIQEVERAIGQPWWTDFSTIEQVQRAIQDLLMAYRPVSLDERKRNERLGEKFPPLAELGRRYGHPFIDHFQIGDDAAALAMAKAQLAIRNAPAKASEGPSPRSSSRKAKRK
jgi:hypothetical protein